MPHGFCSVVHVHVARLTGLIEDPVLYVHVYPNGIS